MAAKLSDFITAFFVYSPAHLSPRHSDPEALSNGEESSTPRHSDPEALSNGEESPLG